MDTAMEDVGRVPAEMSEVANLEPTTTPTLDGWIEGLMNCKQLSETDVQRLCEKVSLSHVLATGGKRRGTRVIAVDTLNFREDPGFVSDYQPPVSCSPPPIVDGELPRDEHPPPSCTVTPFLTLQFLTLHD